MFLNKRHFYADDFSISSLALLKRHLFWLPILSLIAIIFVFLFGPSILLIRTSAVSEPSSNTNEAYLSLSVAGGTDDISLDVIPVNSNGTFRASDTTNNNIEVVTTNYTGYTLGIAASVDGDNALSYTPAGGTTSTIPSITSTVSASDYADDTYAATNDLNNTWGYRPSTLYDSTNNANVSNTDYLPAPTSTIDQVVIAKTDSATDPSVPDGYNIAIGARVGYNTTPGNYTNTFVITAITNLVPYSITYNQNTTDTVTGMPSPNPQTGNVDATTNTVTLASAPTRFGYAFKGWCTVQVADDAACTGIEYSANGDYYIDYTVANNTSILYARWEALTPLYDKVVAEWEAGGSRVQTNDSNVATGILSEITINNSGVFKYNSSIFGASSDANNNYDIYYYRGILDSNLDNSYNNTDGSAGDGTVWPNYVKLNDICWRIVRTTGSGGIKMIYNGSYSNGTNSSSCANTGSNAYTARKVFSSGGVDSIVKVGYKYNSNYEATTTDTPYSELFGTNSNYSGNDTDSTIKDYIENTWFNNNIVNYESILEPSAGYCGDRSLYDRSNALISDNTNIVKPYGGDMGYSFGAYMRAYQVFSKKTSLSCPRNIVDLYTTSSAIDGNKQLTKPVALLTADELNFAGSGVGGSNELPHNNNSYITSGNFWLLSPAARSTNKSVVVYQSTNSYGLRTGGYNYDEGVRPVISLKHDVVVSSGTGTAVDPWVIDAPTQ